MSKYYHMTIAGHERDLLMCPVSDKLDIAAFILFNDVEVTVDSAKELLAKAPAFDVLISAEAKGIPLVYEMARQSGKPYFVARKHAKVYTVDPLIVEVRSITTNAQQTLILSGEEAAFLKGKRVLIVDDVISTGESLRAMETLVERAGGNIVGKCAVLAEGDAADRDDIFFLEPLPLFFK